MSLSAERARRHRPLVLVTALGFLVSACGFSPLYATRTPGSGVVIDLAAISVEAPGDNVNRALRLALEDGLRADQSLSPKYRLAVSSVLVERDVAVQQDTEVTRKNIVLTAKYQLLDIESGETLYSSETFSIAAYNRVESEFANIIAERDARERAATQAAEEIRTQLAVFFERRAQT